MKHQFEYENICPFCGRENSLFPFFMGKKRGYKCDDELSGGCGKMTKGITKTEASTWNYNKTEYETIYRRTIIGYLPTSRRESVCKRTQDGMG